MPHSSPSTAAITYSADSYSLRGAKLMGRQAAGAGFLRAFIETETADRLQCLLLNPADGPAARASLLEAGYTGEVETVAPDALGRLAQSGCLYLPTPGMGDLAWRRLRGGERRFSLCGITHTTASHAVMQTLTDLIVQPLRPWDALICTSHAVRETVTALVTEQAEYLRWRTGATRFELPQLPVIPLGVHTGDYQFTPSQRQRARQQLGIGPEDRVVLFLGRLSFHAKAHPAAMLMMLERCARQQPGRRIHLVQCGWYANEHIEKAYDEAQQALAPSVQHHFLDGRGSDARQTAWASADIFCSLSDNIQETFGLTPIEAMAAGLPVIVTDWDGYKDTVRDGVDGFRIPTLMPGAGLGADLAERYDAGVDSYDLYCGKTCELIAVDVDAATEACARLLADPELCRRMGQAGRERALAVYEWRVIMGRYRDLWARLAEERQHSVDFAGPPPVTERPDRMDPFRLFGMYPTRVLDDGMALSLAQPVSVADYEAMRSLACHRFAGPVLPTVAQGLPLLQRIQAQPGLTVAQLMAGVPAGDAVPLRRGLAWFMKVGWLRLH